MRSTSRRSAAGRSWRLHLQRGGHVHRMCGTRPGLVPQALHLVCDEEKMLERILRRAQTEGRADDTRKAAAPPPNSLLWSLARTLLWTCR